MYIVHVVSYLGNSGTTISPDCLDTLGIKYWFMLVNTLIHVTNVALLGLQDTGKVHLWGGHREEGEVGRE